MRKHSVDSTLDLDRLCEVVSQTYEDSDRERRLTERATKLMEDELLALNASLEERVSARTQDLLEAKSLAEVANRSKSEFLAMMSHELRTPLFGILGMLESILDLPLPNEACEMLDTASSCGKTLLNLLNDILDISKLESGKLELENINFNLPAIVSEVTTAFAPQLKIKNIELSVIVERDVPSILFSDPSRLRQIIFNLLGNAVKFTDQGAIRLRISSVISDLRRVVRFEVEDSGEGISHEMQAKLFAPFQQGDNSISRRKGGSGLGLSICKQLLQVMGGEIGFSSRPGIGSTFWFTIPCQESQARPRENAEIQPVETISAQLADSVNVLVAEDNLVNQKIITKILEKAGCNVVLAENGVEVLSSLKEKDFDIIIMDIQMPIMDGGTATQQIRKLDGHVRDIPIIGLSANALKGDREHYLSLGMNDYLTKPVNRADLLQAVVRMSKKERSI